MPRASDIRFGPSGLGSPAPTGLERCARLGLRTAEVAFTYGVRMTNAQARELGRRARALGIALSVHAPYYLNLASADPAKRRASRARLLDSCERAHHLGASPVVFHAGFYQGRDPEAVYKGIRDEVVALADTVRARGWRTVLAPETTGKPSQFAGLEPLLRLRKETGCGLCVDFAHLLARARGALDYAAVLARLPRTGRLHAHFSGIAWTAAGERKHEPVRKRVFAPLAAALRDEAPRRLTLICEAPPDPFRGAWNLRRWWEATA